MGDDSVIECVPDSGSVKAYTSWTQGAPNYGVTRDQVVSYTESKKNILFMLIMYLFFFFSHKI